MTIKPRNARTKGNVLPSDSSNLSGRNQPVPTEVAVQDFSQGTVISFYGGLGEIGANMCTIEKDGHMVIIDIGVMFPDANHPGIDLILPNWTDLVERAPNIDAIILTHGHEDHIGAVPFFLKDFPGTPIYGSKLTLGLLAAKLDEHPAEQESIKGTINIVSAGEIVPIGDLWEAEFIQVNHSIPDSLAVALHTPDGVIMHTGDFRMDQTPIDGKITDLPHISQLGDEGIDVLLADSTNACIPGVIKSEQTVGQTMRREFANATGRIIVTTFASHIHRVQQAINAAKDTGRKVCFVGRSMLRNMPIAKDLGYLHYDEEDLVDLELTNHLPPEKLVIISTGSQGEPFAALSLMAAGTHRYVDLREGDTVVMASSQIPGNESAIFKVINGLYRQGVNVIHRRDQGVHVSGHASADELLMFHNIVRPTGFVPIHGEYRHLVEHGNLSRMRGTPTVLVCSDGDRVVLTDGALSQGIGFAPGRTYVDGGTVGDISPGILRERTRLSSEGVCVVAVRIDKAGTIADDIEIVQQGLFNEEEYPDLMKRCERNLAHHLYYKADTANHASIQQVIYQEMAHFWRAELGRKPVVVPIIMEV